MISNSPSTTPPRKPPNKRWRRRSSTPGLYSSDEDFQPARIPARATRIRRNQSTNHNPYVAQPTTLTSDEKPNQITRNGQGLQHEALNVGPQPWPRSAQGVPTNKSNTPINHDHVASGPPGVELEKQSDAISTGYHDSQDEALQNLPSTAMTNTILVVSVDNQPVRQAPVEVPLERCQTSRQFFDTMAILGMPPGQAAANLWAVSATFTWTSKPRLIRRDEPRDWKIFCEEIKKVWAHETSQVAQAEYLIEISVHVVS